MHKHPVSESSKWLTYKGKEGPGKGKHIVLISAEQEYRSEQTMPMLAKILSEHHGFDTTVLFGVNTDGLVDPTMKIRWQDKTVVHSIPGLEHLEKADLMIIKTRLLTLPNEQVQHIVDYCDSSKHIIGIRTANHVFLVFMRLKVRKCVLVKIFWEDVFALIMAIGMQIQRVESLLKSKKITAQTIKLNFQKTSTKSNPLIDLPRLIEP